MRTRIVIFTILISFSAQTKEQEKLSLKELSIDQEKEGKKLPKIYEKFSKKGTVVETAESVVKGQDHAGFSIGIQDEFLEKAYENGIDFGQTFRGINLVRPPVKGEVKFIF